RDPEQLEISVDGERVELAKIDPPLGGGRGLRGARPPDPASPTARFAKPLEFRVPIKAGSRLIGVAFLERDEIRDEETLRPRMRSRGPQLSIAAVTISGPLGNGSAGDSPSRRRIFTCHPETTADELPCAKRILLGLERRAWRR